MRILKKPTKKKMLIVALTFVILSMAVQPVAAATFGHDGMYVLRGSKLSGHHGYDTGYREVYWPNLPYVGWMQMTVYYYFDDLPETYDDYKLRVRVNVGGGEALLIRAEWRNGRGGLKAWGKVWTISSDGTYNLPLVDPPSGYNYLTVCYYDSIGWPDWVQNWWMWDHPLAILT